MSALSAACFLSFIYKIFASNNVLIFQRTTEDMFWPNEYLYKHKSHFIYQIWLWR